MSPLPLISHHLYVAAVRSQERARRKREAAGEAPRPTPVRPLEILASRENLAAEAVRPLSSFLLAGGA